LEQNIIKIFTDGSCNTQHNIGAWASILLKDDEKTLISGEVDDTTNNRMELTAVIKAIEYADVHFRNSLLVVYTDSQYVQRIPERMEKLKRNNFITKKGELLPNTDLVKILIHLIENHLIEFRKIKAHQKEEINNPDSNINHNIEVDILARHIVREAVDREFPEVG
jgi:ribonuclease HI